MSDDIINLPILLLGSISRECVNVRQDLSTPAGIVCVAFDEHIDTEKVTDDKNGNIPCITLPVRHVGDMEEFICLNHSLPHGLSSTNSPVRLMGSLPKWLLSEKTALVLNVDDWESVALLPVFLEICTQENRLTEVHLIAKSSMGSDTLPGERYVTGAKIYGGLREVTLIAASAADTPGLSWFFWDSCPIFSDNDQPLRPCLSFLSWWELIERRGGKLEWMGKTNKRGEFLYPAVCRAAGVSEIRWDAKETREKIREAAIRQLHVSISTRGRLFRGSAVSGWTKLQWMRRPSFYKEREDLEHYLDNHVWSPDSWNALWEETMREIAVEMESNIGKWLPVIYPLPEIEWDTKPEKAKDALEKRLSGELSESQSVTGSAIEEANGVITLACRWLRSSPLVRLGYGWANSDVLLEFLENKRNEITERLRLSDHEGRDLTQSLEKLLNGMKNFSVLPEGIEDLHLKERTAVLAEFNRQRLEVLTESMREVNAAARETIWNGILNVALSLITALQEKIPAFLEAEQKLSGTEHHVAAANTSEDTLALLALDETANQSEWEEYWDGVWNAFFDMPDKKDAESAILQGLASLTSLQSHVLQEMEIVAAAAEKIGMNARELRGAWKACAGGDETRVYAAKELSLAVASEYRDTAARLAKEVIRKSAVRCRFNQGDPRIRILNAGNLRNGELKALEAEQVYSTFVPIEHPEDNIKTVILSVTEPFGFDRLRVFYDYAADWITWLEQRERGNLSFERPDLLWTPFSIREGEEYSRIGIRFLTLIARLLESFARGYLDWDRTGRFTGGEAENLTLQGWFSKQWREAPEPDAVPNKEKMIEEYLLLKVGAERLLALPGLSGNSPLFSSFLGRYHDNPVKGILKMQSELIAPSRTEDVWMFKLRA